VSEFIRVYEVGPRDGLQNESTPVSTAQKLELLDRLVAAGLRHVETTSFVHPKFVPQMADADEIMATALDRYDNPDMNLVGLVFNERGYDRAFAAGCRRMALGIAVSETFSRNNTNMDTQKAFTVLEQLVRRAQADGVWTRVYLMTAWVCPFEGPVNQLKTLAYAERVWAMGIDELVVADTIGHAHPLEVGKLLEQIGRRTDMDRLAAHLHDTQVLGLANVSAAISAGVRILDSSVGGLGGCPFAPGAAGNLATEDLVFLAYKMGFGTGIDFGRLWDVVRYLDGVINRPVGGRIRDWWEANVSDEPELYRAKV
jgi:hydroxymethylglutaryl-CoA lyase